MRKFRNGTKKVAAIVFCGIMLLGLIGCGAKSEAMYDAAAPQMNYGSAWDGDIYYTESDMVMEETMEAPMEEAVVEEGKMADYAAGGAGMNPETGAVETTSRKVIKTANLNLQTLEFEKFQTALDAKIAECGAYLQYADVSGSEYYGERKNANYTIRVPEANLNRFLEGVEGIATVTNKTVGEEDITLTYVDTEARIKTLEIEQERLLELLEKADNLDSIIRLEQRLSEVRYSMESYQSRLRTYNDKITYSTVYIYVHEVVRVQEKAPETLLERIKTGWSDTMYDINEGTKDFLVWFIVNLPYLVFWAAVIVILVVVLKKKNAKRKAKRLGKQSGNNETVLDGKE